MGLLDTTIQFWNIVRLPMMVAPRWYPIGWVPSQALEATTFGKVACTINYMESTRIFQRYPQGMDLGFYSTRASFPNHTIISMPPDLWLHGGSKGKEMYIPWYAVPALAIRFVLRQTVRGVCCLNALGPISPGELLRLGLTWNSS